MKKQILLIAALFLTAWATAQAQTQQGYVKTKGRLANDGSIIPGQGLKGATVSIKGRTAVLVNSDDGAFSFPVTEAQFRVDSVKKKGYQLVDMDACPKTYNYSNNPLYIVMETPEQQLQDQLDAETKIRHNLQQQLLDKQKEIETLRKQNKISQEEYRQALQKLYQDQESNEQLISDMVKRYSELDYDQLDEFYRQVSFYIENGELMKADSLLRTKGNVPQQVKEQLRKGQAIKEQEKQLGQAKATYSSDLDELAKRCFSFHETFAAQHMNDSAAYYLKLRVDLDSTNVDWLIDAGVFYLDYTSKYDVALNYFNKSIDIPFEPNNSNNTVAHRYCLIGSAYNNMDNYENALKFDKLALMSSKKSNINLVDFATAYNDIGYTYFKKGIFDTALIYYDSALLALKPIQSSNLKYIATTYNNIGVAYFSKCEYDNALEYYEKSKIIADSLNIPLDIATSLNNMGEVYLKKEDFQHALSCSKKALDIIIEHYGECHPRTSTTFNNLGYVYFCQKDYDSAMVFYKKSLDLDMFLIGKWNRSIADSFNNIAGLFEVIKEYDSAIFYFEKAIDIAEIVLGCEHPSTAIYYVNIGYVYYKLEKYDDAICYNKKALEIIKKVLGENHIRVANCNDNIGFIYKQKGDYRKALEYYLIALDILNNTLGEKHPDSIRTMEKIADVQSKLKEQE